MPLRKGFPRCFLLFASATVCTSARLCSQPGLPSDSNDSESNESESEPALPSHRVTIWSLGGRSSQLTAELVAALYEEILNLEASLRHFQQEQWPECSPDEQVDILFGTVDKVPCGLMGGFTTEYIVEHGIYYWLPNSTANEARRWPFDWFLSHVHDPAVHLAFPPLSFTNLPVGAGGCTAEFNAKHPLPSGRQWCDARGRFVPPQCEAPEATCSELYHTEPWWIQGAVEALIVTHNLPYVVVYLGFKEHKRLLERQQPFIALGWEPGHWNGTVQRVQFPIQLDCDHSHDGSPETPHFCDMLARPTEVYLAPAFWLQMPAAALVLGRSALRRSELEELLQTRSVDGESAACAYLRNHQDELPYIAGKCASADQPLDQWDADCTCHDGLIWNYTTRSCAACFPNAFCFHNEAFLCGYPHGEVGAGRRRRARGPNVPDDCICAPGYGLANDYEAYRPGTPPHYVCQPCPEDFYSAEWSSGACVDKCPMHAEAKDGGARKEGDCTCKRGYYLARHRPLLCKACPFPERQDVQPGILCFGSEEVDGETRSKEPYALPGWFLVETGSLDSPEGRTIIGQQCTSWWSCTGNNTCREGTLGPLCSVCAPGYVHSSDMEVRCVACDEHMGRHAIIHCLEFVCLTLYVNSLYSIVSGDAAKKASLLPMITKLIYHNAFLTWPVATYPLWVAWTAPQAAVLDGWVFHQRCLFMHLGVASKPGQALAVASTIVFFPALALLGNFLWCRLRVCCNAKSFARAQVEVNRAGQLLNMCEWLEDLEVRNSERMEAIRAEFRTYQSDRIKAARVSHIWRVLRRPHTSDTVYRMFWEDSVGLIILWMVVLYPQVTAEVTSSFHWWRPLGWTGERLAFGTLMVCFGEDHLPIFVFGLLFCVFYCVGFPLLCLWRIKNLFRERKLLQGTHYLHWGYLQYTFELRSPAIYTEVMHMLEQTFMALMVSEASLDSPLFASSIQQPIVMGFLVAHCWGSPYDKIAYGILHKLMGITVLVCALTAEVSGFDRAGQKVGTDVSQIVDTMSSVVGSVNNRETQVGFAPIFLAGNMVCILAFNIAFWFLVFTSVGRELLHRLYSLMSIFSAKDTGTFWDTINSIQVLRWLGNFYDAFLDVIMVLFRLATERKSQCLSVTMEMKQTGDRTSREIVVHEQHKKLRRLQSADPSGPGPTRGSKTGRLMRKKLAIRARGVSAKDKTLGIMGGVGERRVLDRQDRGNMALAMSEVMETLFVVHGLQSLPTCIMEFILADALYFVHQGPREEKRQRQSLFSFVWKHGSGQVRGLEQLFEGTSDAPVLSSHLRPNALRKTASNLSMEFVTESLLISDLQRYVRHLRFEDPASMSACIHTFAEAFRSSDYSSDRREAHHRSSDRKADSITQTSFLVHQCVQVENVSTRETQTDAIVKRSGEKQAPSRPSAPTADTLHEDTLVLREEAAAVCREAELLLADVADSLEGTAKSAWSQGPKWLPGPVPSERPVPSGTQGPLWVPPKKPTN